MKKVISTPKAPAAIGPYSQAIEVNGMVYTSGIIPVVPATGEIPEGSVAQAKQAFENLSNLLEAAGTSMDKVVKTTVFIKEMNDFGAINEVLQRNKNDMRVKRSFDPLIIKMRNKKVCKYAHFFVVRNTFETNTDF